MEIFEQLTPFVESVGFPALIFAIWYLYHQSHIKTFTNIGINLQKAYILPDSIFSPLSISAEMSFINLRANSYNSSWKVCFDLRKFLFAVSQPYFSFHCKTVFLLRFSLFAIPSTGINSWIYSLSASATKCSLLFKFRLQILYFYWQCFHFSLNFIKPINWNKNFIHIKF